MKTTHLFFLIILLNIFFVGCSNKDSSSSDSSEDEIESAVVTADKNATFVELLLAEVTPVATPNVDNTPNYIFSSMGRCNLRLSQVRQCDDKGTLIPQCLVA